MSPFTCGHGNPVRPEEPFTLDQCHRCYSDAGGKAIRPSTARLHPCRHEGAILESCTRLTAEIAELRHVRDCDLHGRCTRGAVSTAVPSCKACPDYDPDPSASFHLSAGGIGDSVSGLYTACGLADAGYSVNFHTYHRAWLTGVEHPNLTLLEFAEVGPDGNRNYDLQLRAASGRSGGSRTQWYADNISSELGIPRFVPSRPKSVLKPAPVFESDYTVLSPFSSHSGRQWPAERWTALALHLAESGHRVLACGSPGDEARLHEIFGSSPVEYWWGMPAAWMLSVIGHAKHFIGNDSGMAHIAGLLGTPARVIMTHLPAEYVFSDAPSVRGVSPEGWDCLGCGWQPERGYAAECQIRCAALSAIGADLQL